MIHIFFPTGGFGSTIEFVLRQTSVEYFDSNLNNVNFSSNGSMHGFEKLNHLRWKEDFLKIPYMNFNITTPVYPGFDQTAQEAVDTLLSVVNKHDKVVFVKLNSIEDYLFCTYLSLYKSSLYKDQLKNKNLPIWDEREIAALKLAHKNFINLKTDNSWITVNYSDIISNFYNTMSIVLNSLNLSIKNYSRLEEISLNFITANQTYINRFKIIKDYVKNRNVFLPENFTLYEEIIIHTWLILDGFDLKCYNLKKLPADPRELEFV